MPSSQEERIEACDESLRSGTELKVLVEGGGDAISHLARAYELATGEPRLPDPWPQITAYRLAHVLMRGAKSFSELQRVEELFQEAGRRPLSELGLMPRVNRIAALHRMSLVAPSAASRAECLGARSRLFAKLCEDLHESVEMDVDDEHRAAFVDGNVVSLMEILSYCTGEEYRRIPRVMSPIGDLVLSEEWTIIGTQGVGGNRRIRFNRALAEAEVRSRIEAGQVDLAFRADRYGSGERGEIWVPEHARVPVGQEPVRYLAALCHFPADAARDIRRAVFGPFQQNTRPVKKVTQELKGALREVPGAADLEVVFAGRRGTPVSLNPKVRVVGMVHRDVLAGSRRGRAH